MLKSLFGELAEAPASAPGGFGAAALLHSRRNRLNPAGRLVEQRQHDLFVTGSAAQAMREHLAATRDDLGVASCHLALVDVGQRWAGDMIEALAEATGHPVERLNLREQATLATLASIERIEVARDGAATLKVYHPMNRHGGSEQAEIELALMERSHVAAVFVDTLRPAAADALLAELYMSTLQPAWRCPVLVFVLGPDQDWLGQRIAGIAWPPALRIEQAEAPRGGAIGAWNAVLAAWERLQVPDAQVEGTSLPDAAHVSRLLQPLLRVEGVLCAALVAGDGTLMAAAQRRDDSTDLAVLAAATSRGLQAQRQAAHHASLDDPDELLVGAGEVQWLLRRLTGRDSFLLLMLDRVGAQLALARFKLIEIERSLG